MSRTHHRRWRDLQNEAPRTSTLTRRALPDYDKSVFSYYAPDQRQLRQERRIMKRYGRKVELRRAAKKDLEESGS